jgi:hypothetical protein
MYSACCSCQILMKPEFSQRTFEKYSMSNLVKIRPVGTELFHADIWTDRRIENNEANSRFPCFCEHT